jgi:septum formation protein
LPRRLILASASPRRKELLACLGLPFEVIPSQVDEDDAEYVGLPRTVAERLARAKASDISLRLYTDALAADIRSLDACVIGCDTVVALEDIDPPALLAKPSDAVEARSMLSRLSGKTHTVYTGISLVWQHWNSLQEEYETTRISESIETDVRFRELSAQMIDWYVATGEPFDKAGGYGIQGHASAFVEAVYGDYFNVVGLPIHTVAKMLEEIGIAWWRGPAALE